MTYAQLLAKLQKLSHDQLQMDVTIEVDNEFFGVHNRLKISSEVDNDALDDLHPYLICNV